MNLAQHILTAGLRLYRLIASPVLAAVFVPLGFGCRFSPTCSAYALEAVQKHGAIRGSLLAASRLCRCHPFCKSGFDPVPTNMASADPGSVAQVSNLLYRGLPACRRRENPDAIELSDNLPIGNRRNSRLETCATRTGESC